ncbi:sulfatase-like hydrolase/transferase [Candidatus Uhrbacteria bacterium]|nr:sulfatase-like hydrolase/transferase [Candidatus Uhrbacteria bacterium]
MRRWLVLLLVCAAWVAAHVAYFGYYNRLLALPYGSVSAGFAALWSVWMLSLIVFFRSRLARATVGSAYVFFLGWAVVNFAYYQVFHNYLVLSAAKISGVNGAMIGLLKDFYFLVPPTMAAATLGLLAAFIVVCRTARAPARVRKFQVVLVPDGSAESADRPAHRRFRIAAGILIQALLFQAADTAVAGYARAANAGKAEESALADLGVYGFAVAAHKKTRELRASDRSNAASSAVSLDSSKTNLEALRQRMAEITGSAGRTSWPPPAKPPNVIVYQMESTSYWPLEQQPPAMPFLDSLIRKQGRLPAYFSNGCDTIDAEFAINCGFLPDTFGPISDLYAKNDYRCLPTLLKERGYATSLYHANDLSFWNRDSLAPAWGFDKLVFKPEFNFREPDGRMFDRVIEDLKKAVKPVYTYVIGMTAHSPHNEHFQKHYNKVYNLGLQPFAGPLNDAAKSITADEATVRLYLGFLKAQDDGLKRLFDRLAEEGLLDSTIVLGFGDHRYYEPDLADPWRQFIEYNRIPFFLHLPGGAVPALPAIASHIDVPSTIYQLVGGDPAALPPSFLGTSMLTPAPHPMAVTKCLGRTLLYDGDVVAEGNAVLSSYRTAWSKSGDNAGNEKMIAALKSIGFMSDLSLRRNELYVRAAGPLQAARRTIQMDDITDSDHDGLSDLREAGIGTDPAKADSDGDGFDDGDEVLHGFNPRGPGKWIRSAQ